MLKNLAIAFIILLGLLIGWYLLFPLLGGAIVITTAIWGIVVGSVVAFCVGILLLFILTGAGIFILGGIIFAWTVLAIIFFPVMFPVLIPLFIIFLFVSYIRRRQVKKSSNQS